MTPLERQALKGKCLTREEVNELYTKVTSCRLGDLARVTMQLCISHERLQLEVDGLNVMLSDAEQELAREMAAEDHDGPDYII